jgi:HEAT repeat protein
MRRVGAAGFAALGTNASAAVPMLIEIAMHHPDEDGRYTAVYATGTLYAAAEPAIPFLIQCLTNEYFNIRSAAASGLGYIGRQPEIVVPALIRYFELTRTSPHMTERLASIDSLAHFGTNAKPAAPLISPLLTNPVQLIRMYATNALLRMEVETVAKPE